MASKSHLVDQHTDPANSEQDQYDDDHDYDDHEDHMSAAAAQKYVIAAQGKKSQRRAGKSKNADAIAAAAAKSAATPGISEDVIVGGPSTEKPNKHERKQHQNSKHDDKAYAAAAERGGGTAGAAASSSSRGIADGHMTETEENMVKHALTQLDYLKQVGPFVFEIKQGVQPFQRNLCIAGALLLTLLLTWHTLQSDSSAGLPDTTTTLTPVLATVLVTSY